jgi:hypothetical protein
MQRLLKISPTLIAEISPIKSNLITFLHLLAHTLTTKLLIKLLQDKRVHLPSSELRML